MENNFLGISPVYRMELLEQVEKTIWEKYSSYKKVEQYIRFNQTFYNHSYPDFEIYHFTEGKNQGKINLSATLANLAVEMPDKLLKIAIDLGIETPGFIPLIPTFRNKLKDDYKNASKVFEKAFHNIEKDPADSVGNANSVLESIIKEILSDENFSHIESSNKTSKYLVKEIIKVFELNPESPKIPRELKVIASSLTTVAKAIEDLRSDKTLHHGQETGKYLIDQPLYAYFVVNACATVGLFLIDFYENKFPKKTSI
ncbi:abortive infection family protein [Streptococcus thoraltensis]|uniref:abortive infection family protein n=1 Tax=Streptococcus thoraltensis TaxID=55085 RepID=UPI0003620632|nr:abortive infection family protein [Streptococcus thoraltensis]MDY4760880.1 abortive infection family protein [Streptococcus thoraltensis]